MEKDLGVKLIKKMVYSESTDQLTDLIVNEFITEKEKEDYEYYYPDFISKRESRDYSEATEISIDVIKDIITSVEKKGANFITFDFHGDHGEYDIYGWRIERASDGNIKMHDAKNALIKEKKNELNKAIGMVNKLDVELKKLL